ncbi:MAG: hypothetical protein CMG67_03140 [Candidatus Marinimicrobia bacterium]|nr:hypothetical protein [Candidatus Neomarinimicrobiota bacterium]|tara:strand:+ start:22 stop:654 length:633 start_codon:yes stop_codon:yes gene_type:complete
MIKKILIVVTLLSGMALAQDEMPGLGMYMGGVMGTAGGNLIDNLTETDGVDVGYNMAFPMVGASYSMMAGPLPLMVGAGLGARTFKITVEGVDDELTGTYQYMDVWAAMPYPVMDGLNVYGGMLFGFPMNGESCIGDECVDVEDEAMPEGPDMSLVFGIGYTLPVMDGALGLNLGYAHGLAELNVENGIDEGSWTHSGMFMTLGYDIPGM